MTDEKRSIYQLRDEAEAEFERRNITFRPASESWHSGKTEYGARQDWTVSDLIQNACYWLQCSQQQMNVVLSVMRTDKRRDEFVALEAWLDRIEEYRTDDSELRHFLKLIEAEGTSPIEHEANVAAMKQWMWVIKKNIRGEEVGWHVMPIFWSRTNGSGKSRSVERLVAGRLTHFTKFIDVDDLNEKFSAKMLANTLVAFFDELTGVGKADASGLKKRMSGTPLENRSMRSESGFYAANRISCIATTNERPPHGFSGEIGERRLWSIHFRETPYDETSEQAAALELIRLERLWSAVSVDDPQPHYNMPPELAVFMREQRKRNLAPADPLDEFCESHLLPMPGNKLWVKELRDSYRQYCLSCGQKASKGNYGVFCDRLNDMGITTHNKGGRYYIPDHALRDEVMDGGG